ncbi:MAG TPA: SRPBCC domain-containing protein [Gemmatimonadales bacterium]
MADPIVLELEILIRATPATVYRFLSDPARFRAWMGEGAELGDAVGAPIRVAYPNGESAEGHIVARIPDRRLVFSDGYAGNPELAPGSTTVTIDLIGEGSATRVVLRHDGLPSDSARTGHELGWTHYLSRLRGVATAEEMLPIARLAVAAWIAAWGETDPVRRAELIADCWEDGSLFADHLGIAEGPAGLGGYIAGAQQFLPGSRLELRGPVEVVLDRVRFQWAGILADGTVIGAGVNFGELSPGGRYARMTGWWNRP